MISTTMGSAVDSTILLERARPEGGDQRVVVVRVVEGPVEKHTATLPLGKGVVGRAAAADVQIPDDAVSQFHVELRSDGDDVLVTDLGSRNGTRSGRIRLERAAVPSGTVIVIGGTHLELTLGEPVQAARSKATSFGGLVGSAPAMRETYAILEKLCRTKLSVLIDGATGTGKELAARALHDEGPRAREPFLALNCAAVPPGLAESVLFGTEAPGESRPGLFESAGGGTVLLDHVGDLPADLQPKLLRALDQREVVPVGATAPRKFEARIVSIATNLRERVNRGAFREDLYFRLAQARVSMPSLEEHPEDKKALAQYLLGLIEERPAARSFSVDALDAIATRSYAGNVRELRNVVERAAVLAEGPSITLQDLAFERVLADAQAAVPGPSTTSKDDDERAIESFKDAKRSVIDDFEQKYLVRLLARAGKNVSRAAALAGIERQSLRDLLKRHGLRGSDDDR